MDRGTSLTIEKGKDGQSASFSSRVTSEGAPNLGARKTTVELLGMNTSRLRKQMFLFKWKSPLSRSAKSLGSPGRITFAENGRVPLSRAILQSSAQAAVCPIWITVFAHRTASSGRNCHV